MRMDIGRLLLVVVGDDSVVPDYGAPGARRRSKMACSGASHCNARAGPLLPGRFYIPLLHPKNIERRRRSNLLSETIAEAARMMAEIDAGSLPVGEEVLYCFDDQDLDDIAQNMGDVKVRRLPVV